MIEIVYVHVHGHVYVDSVHYFINYCTHESMISRLQNFSMNPGKINSVSGRMVMALGGCGTYVVKTTSGLCHREC